MAESMQDIDFGPKSNGFWLGLFALIFSILGTLGVVLMVDDLRYGFAWGDFAGWLGAFTLYVAIVLFSVLYLTAPSRTRFTEEGILRGGIFGTRFVAWNAVDRATVSNYRGIRDLTIRAPGQRSITIPLADYRRPKRLLAEIQQRIPVPIQIAPWILDSFVE